MTEQFSLLNMANEPEKTQREKDSDRIDFLKKELQRHNRLYHTFDNPEISDPFSRSPEMRVSFPMVTSGLLPFFFASTVAAAKPTL